METWLRESCSAIKEMCNGLKMKDSKFVEGFLTDHLKCGMWFLLSLILGVFSRWLMYNDVNNPASVLL